MSTVTLQKPKGRKGARARSANSCLCDGPPTPKMTELKKPLVGTVEFIVRFCTECMEVLEYSKPGPIHAHMPQSESKVKTDKPAKKNEKAAKKKPVPAVQEAENAAKSTAEPAKKEAEGSGVHDMVQGQQKPDQDALQLPETANTEIHDDKNAEAVPGTTVQRAEKQHEDNRSDGTPAESVEQWEQEGEAIAEPELPELPEIPVEEEEKPEPPKPSNGIVELDGEPREGKAIIKMVTKQNMQDGINTHIHFSCSTPPDRMFLCTLVRETAKVKDIDYQQFRGHTLEFTYSKTKNGVPYEATPKRVVPPQP